MDDMDEIYVEFLTEVNEVLDQFDRDMVELEKDPSSRTLLDRIFRGIHTIKGTSGVLGLEKLVSISHVGETLLSKMRDGEMRLDPRSTTVLLAMSDALRTIVGCFAGSGTEGDGDFSNVVRSITALIDSPASLAHSPDQAHSDSATSLSGRLTQAAATCVPSDEGPSNVPSAAAEPVTPLLRQSETENDAKTKQANAVEAPANTIRVDVGLLDKLMDLVGELVLARNQIMQFTAAQSGVAITAAAQRLNLITAELQSGVMKTRMQPIGTVWHKLPRVLRNLAIGCGKEVELVMDGADTELDRTILEAIKDPLTHIIRNAVDHGIETPDARRRKGKSPVGTLSLRAYHEGGKVNIEIRDDGAGVDLEAVKRRAIERRLVTETDVARMSERELVGLLFQPGFSTAREVTNISGRGVGMDVVKTNIAKIGGTVDLQSVAGQGTTLKIKIPLTLAIIPALIVTSSSNCFAIPQVNLLELVRLEGVAAATAIEYIHDAPVYRLRGTLLPIVYLDRVLEISPPDEERRSEIFTIVVLQADERVFGLVVDEVNDSEEIVVKPLGNLLKGVHIFAGATIMGDGKVALILDVMGLGQKAGVLTEQRTRSTGTVTQKTAIKRSQDEWLIVRVGQKRLLAIPLSRVDRLEVFSASSVEWSGDHQVVQYRGEIMPIVFIAEVLGLTSVKEVHDTMQVVVVSSNGRKVGAVVDSITDIIEEEITIDKTRQSQALRGSAVIAQRVTDLLDIDAMLSSAFRNAETLEAVAIWE